MVGVPTGVPVPDLDALGAWLDRIADAPPSPGPTRPASPPTSRRGAAAADARRAEIDAVLGPARAGMRRREEGQGLWTALRAKAGARKLDENPDVVEALTAAQDVLWQAPCDLDAAEAALTRLSAVLTSRPQEDR